MSERVDLIIHGHFYQPPREDPWLEEIEGEPSAAPFNNWNERIHSECYRPNANSRILTETEKIVAIDNNYEHLSFNFGPTLLSWMDKYDPDTLAQIVKADAVSREQRSGHGNAIAQGYNHIIMPLANARDKETQIVWGARDFEHRFSRPPEAMWMPETAVDLKTLAELVRLGLEFVILSPYQASSVQSEEGEWRDVEDGSIDTSCAYRVETDAGPISVFFYHGPISAEISFMHLLRSGETFMNRLIESINGSSMLNMATDGEIYGHHEKFGDMCIAYAFSEMSDKDSEFAKQFRLTNYGEFLERNPPTLEAKIKKGGSSWSCEHGIERWQSNCGCRNDTSRPPFQQWRESLRVGLNDLRDQLQEIFEERGSETIKDVYGARNDYINVILSGFDEERKKDFASRWFKVRDREEESWRLLESQRNAMLMFTSCGWFFDDLGGIEPGQLMAYASRAIDAARPYIDEKAEAQFVKTLAEGESDQKKMNGQQIYYSMSESKSSPESRVLNHNLLSNGTKIEPHASEMYAVSMESEAFWYDAENQIAEETTRNQLGRGIATVHDVRTEASWVFAWVARFGPGVPEIFVAETGPKDPWPGGDPRDKSWNELRPIFGKRDDFQRMGLKDLFRSEAQLLLQDEFQGAERDIEVFVRGALGELADVMTRTKDLKPQPGFRLLDLLSSMVGFLWSSHIRRSQYSSALKLQKKFETWGLSVSKEQIERELSAEIDRLCAVVKETGERKNEIRDILALLSAVRPLEVKIEARFAQEVLYNLVKKETAELQLASENTDGVPEGYEKFLVLLEVADQLNIDTSEGRKLLEPFDVQLAEDPDYWP